MGTRVPECPRALPDLILARAETPGMLAGVPSGSEAWPVNRIALCGGPAAAAKARTPGERTGSM